MLRRVAFRILGPRQPSSSCSSTTNRHRGSNRRASIAAKTPPDSTSTDDAVPSTTTTTSALSADTEFCCVLQFDYDTLCGTCPFREFIGAGGRHHHSATWHDGDSGYGRDIGGGSGTSLMGDDLRVLGLDEPQGRTYDVDSVKAAFRRRALELHPDTVPPGERPAAEEQFKRLLNSFRRMKEHAESAARRGGAGR